MKGTNSPRVCVPGWTRLLAAIGLCATASLSQAANQQLDGIWRIERPVFAVRTVDGKTPPLKPEAAKLYAARQAARKAGDTSFDSATWCASVGMPRILFIDYPFELVVREPYVTFLHEWNWWARIVYLDGALSNNTNTAMSGPPGAGAGGAPAGAGGPNSGPPAGAPGFGPPTGPRKEAPGPMGLSKGKWEGNTLVVETTDVSHLTLLDSAGLPHSEALKITERVRLRSADVLENRIRIEDPEIFTAPWETLVTYKRQRKTALEEDVCLDRIKTGEPAVKE